MASFQERVILDGILYRAIAAIHDAGHWQNADDVEQAFAAIEEARSFLSEAEEVLEKRSNG